MTIEKSFASFEDMMDWVDWEISSLSNFNPVINITIREVNMKWQVLITVEDDEGE